MKCHKCGQEFQIDSCGIAQHLTSIGEIDYDQDEDHIPFTLEDLSIFQRGSI
jgi:hypothetical protein